MSKKEFKKDVRRCRVIAVPKKIRKGNEEKVVYDIYKME